VDETIEYVKERTAYGQPIAKFQGVAFKIAESASLIEAARALCYDSLRRRDNGESHTMQAAMAKLLAPRWSVDIIHECILLHGHYGWSMDFPIQQRLRDVMGLEIGDGPANIQKMIIARELIGREFQSW
jgi:cyclohexanecarboxyl-CoA dehydrogenase